MTCKYAILGSFILFFSLIGAYLVSFNTFDIDLMIGFAMVAIFSFVRIFRWLRFYWVSSWVICWKTTRVESC